MRIPSPFPRENFLVLHVPLDTRFAARALTIDKLACALADMVSGRVGNYLACFPSYAYMRMAADALERLRPDIRLLVQQRDMDEAAREAFLQCLPPAPTHTTLAFVTLGGLFTEGIDLPGDRLVGAAVVGIGLAQGDTQRDLLAEYYNGQESEGYDRAYLYPALTRVSQAGGRVIRTPDDRGVLLLIDERYATHRVRALLPPHWQVRGVAPARVGAVVSAFFGEDEG